jgi:hypothetical protein
VSIAGMIAEKGPLVPYCVHFLLAERMRLDGDALHQALRESIGQVDRLPLAVHNAVAFVYSEHTTNFADRRGVPMSHLIAYADEAPRAEELEVALAQTHDWSGAREAAAPARARIVLSDQAGLQPAERLELFVRACRVLVEQLPVLAVHWLPSERLVHPQSLLVDGAVGTIAWGPVNVRRFPDAQVGDVVLDTLGLAAFNVWDLQHRCTADAADAAAAQLAHLAATIFGESRMPKAGDLVAGVAGPWRCHAARAANGPSRDVIALLAERPLRVGFVRCPACAWVPDLWARWSCDCGFMWNTFDTGGKCPACEFQWLETTCLECHRKSAHVAWYVSAR